MSDQEFAQRRFLAEMEDEEEMVNRVTQNQLAQFADKRDKCAGIQLPKGVMLRYNLAESLYFYLESGVDGGKIRTCVYASSSPYEKTNRVMVGEIATPIFDEETAEDCNVVHSRKVESAVNDWIDFVSDDVEADESAPFTSYTLERDKS